MKTEDVSEGGHIAAGPHVRLSVNQAQLLADYLGISRKRVSAAWKHAMENGKPVWDEYLKPVGASVLDTRAERLQYAEMQTLADAEKAE